MKKAYLYLASNSRHIGQPVAGFLMLQEKKKLKVSFLHQPSGFDIAKLPHEHCVAAFIDGKTLIFDMADGYNSKAGFNFTDTLQNVDFYFKRSFSSQKNISIINNADLLQKLHPYGFNYYIDYFSIGSLRRLIRTAKNLYNDFEFASPIRSMHQAAFIWDAQTFVREPIAVSMPPRIIFCTRLWNESCFTPQELEHINSTRIELVRALKREYGSSFVGGVEQSQLSQELCPDIILPSDISQKANYLELMQNADICIGSIGLHQSTGWKTGEYIAASKAIVNEKIVYEVPGNFQEKVNYLPFTSVDECMEAVAFLYNDPEAIRNMSEANREYYQKYNSPEKLISNALHIAGIEI